MISIKNLSFAYGQKKIFENFSLDIAKGERICFFAPSGFGKTTLLRILMGLERPSSGEIGIKKGLGFSVVFQEDRLIPTKTVLQNLTLFGSEKKATELLEKLELADAKNKYPSALSGGMKRRASIARALINTADVYVFDEPFSGLDEKTKRTAAELISREIGGKTLLLISHEATDAALLNAKIINL